MVPRLLCKHNGNLGLAVAKKGRSMSLVEPHGGVLVDRLIPTCPHNNDQHGTLSSTAVRALLQRGEAPPPEYSRREMVDVLLQHQHADARA